MSGEEDKKKPLILTDYDPDEGFEKVVLVVDGDGTITAVPEDEYQRRCSGMKV